MDQKGARQVIRRVTIPVAVLVLGLSALCVVSVTCREDGLRIVAASDVVPVEGRRRKPLSPDEQARVDHLKAERARRHGIFMHYLIGGLATTGFNPLSWITSTVSSLFGFAWTVGTDLLMLVLIGLLLFGLAILAGLYGTYRFIRWLFSRSK